MCLLIAAEANKPSRALMERAATSNPDGAGLAWIDGEHVRWAKSLDAGRIIDRACAPDIRPPFLVHFRWETTGGVRQELCHPFPISAKVGTAGTGRARSVLAHNGVWSDWQAQTLLLASRMGVKVPEGHWSDSRALAFVAYHLGLGALDLIGEKVAVLDPSGLQMFGRGWHNLESVWLSNRSDLPMGKSGLAIGSNKSSAWWEDDDEDACKIAAPKTAAKGTGKKARKG